MNSSLLGQPGQQTHFWDQSISFISPAIQVDVHRHRCFQVVITLTSTFDCTIDGQFLTGLKGFIVNQNIPHSCRVNEGEVFVSFIEADSYWGGQLRSWMRGRSYLNLADVLEPTSFHSLLPCEHEQLANDDLIAYINLFFERIFLPVSSRRLATISLSSVQGSGAINARLSQEDTDERILSALQYINQHLHQRLVVEDMAALMYLSPARARHLFASETGIPFSQYVLWKRIKRILKATISGEGTLADACIDFGFVDQPHFNKQFKQIFGTAPNALIKGGRVIM